MKHPKRPGTLLIVDDLAEVRWALRRYFNLYFERVLIAANPDQAEACLERDKPPYLLCDFWLGDKHPASTALIPGWRERHPSLRRVALMTGSNATALGRTNGVDIVFAKPLNLDHVLEFFASG